MAQVAPTDSGDGELFGNYHAQPDASDGEPVFWNVTGGQTFADDDFLRQDAPDFTN